MPHELTNHCLDCGKPISSAAVRCRSCNSHHVGAHAGKLSEYRDPSEEEIAEIESRRQEVLAAKLERELAGLTRDSEREWWE